MTNTRFSVVETVREGTWWVELWRDNQKVVERPMTTEEVMGGEAARSNLRHADTWKSFIDPSHGEPTPAPRESLRRSGTFLSRRYTADFDPLTMSEEGPRVVLRSTHPPTPAQTQDGLAFPVVRNRGILATVVRALETDLEMVRRYLSREHHDYPLQRAQEDSEDLQAALAWARAELERWTALQGRES